VYTKTFIMADDRFARLTADHLQSILENRDSVNTKNCTEAAKRILADYCGAKELIYDEIIEKPKASI
jgi:intergrase/recombinase